MKCIIENGSKQYHVEKDKVIYIDSKKNYKEGQEIVFNRVLYVKDNNKVIIGKPYIKDAQITGIIEAIVKGPKLQWIKYGKSSFMRKKGYRHKYARVKIKEIRVGNS